MDTQVMATIEELLERLERMQEMGNLQQLETLRKEKAILLKGIESYNRAPSQMAKFFQAIEELILILQISINKTNKKHATADITWLAYWGIREKGKEETKIKVK